MPLAITLKSLYLRRCCCSIIELLQPEAVHQQHNYITGLLVGVKF